MPQIGNSGLTGGSQTGGITSDTYFGRLLEMPEDGYITKIYASMQSVSGSNEMQGAIFSATGSDTANAVLSIDTTPSEITTTEKYCVVTLATPLFLSSGTKFFATVRSIDTYLIRYTTGGLPTETFQRWGESYPNFQDPDTNSGNYYSGSEILFIYVEYTPASSAYGVPSLKGVQSITGVKSIIF